MMPLLKKLYNCNWSAFAHFSSNHLSHGLSKLGRFESRYPWTFIVLPIILTIALSYGFSHMEELAKNQNALELYIPDEGRSKAAKKRIFAEFGDIYMSQLDPINGVTFSLILNRPDHSNILRSDFIADYLWLRNVLEGIKVVDPIDGNEYTYSQLCWKERRWGDKCIPDILILLTDKGLDGYKQLYTMKFPDSYVEVPQSFNPVPTTVKVRLPLGGVTVDNSSLIREAKAIMMNFHFPFPPTRLTTRRWERQFVRVLSSRPSESSVSMSWFTMRQFQNDLDSIANGLKQLIPALLLVVTVFCIGSCCVADWVHSKPWIAFAGVITALFAMASGFGFLLLLWVPVIDIVYVAPFLILSIGVDDTFLMLASWRRTRIELPVAERMALTFTDAAVSITITSLTDILSLSIGTLCAFPAVRQFCLYTAVSLIFSYLYQITFFGACMVISGRREEQNRHCCFFFKLASSSDAKSRSLLYKVFCTGGDGKERDECCCDVASSMDGTVVTNTYKSLPSVTPVCVISPRDNMFNIFFKRYYAPLLRCKAVKVIAGLSYVAYLIMAVYGVTTIRIGMNYAELLPDDVSTAYYLDTADKYFTDHLPPMEVLLPPLNYTNATQRVQALELAHKFDNTQFTGPVEFWLLSLLTYVASRNGAIRTDNQFFYWLDRFLSDTTYAHHRHHIKVLSATELGCTRFLVNVHHVHYGRENSFQQMVHNILHTSTLNVSAYHGTFQLGEQQAEVLPATLQTVGTATAAMLLISFLLIPKIACSVCLAACIISTNVGVLGAMALWGVRLDIVSMITILMSIGISVDFVAHISYFYVQALELNIPASKAQRALQYLGLPIVQGATSTVLGMLVLLAIRAYIIRAFVKTMLLVIFFGLYHGLLLLPIVLALFIRDVTPAKKNSTEALPPDKQYSPFQNGGITEISELSCRKHVTSANGRGAPTLSTIIPPDSMPSPSIQPCSNNSQVRAEASVECRGRVEVPRLRRLWLRTVSASVALLALKVQRLQQQAFGVSQQQPARSTPGPAQTTQTGHGDSCEQGPDRRVKVISWLMRSPSPSDPTTVRYYNSFDDTLGHQRDSQLKPTSVNAYPT